MFAADVSTASQQRVCPKLWSWLAGRHHFRVVDEASGALMGAISDLQVARVRELVTEAGNTFDYVSFPEMGHSMHGQDPQRYVDTLTEWAVGLSS